MEKYEDGMTAPRHYVESGDMVRYDAPHEYGMKHNRYSRADGESPWMVVAEIFGGMGKHGEMSRYRGQPRTSSGRFKRMRFAETFETDKEQLAAMIAEEYEPEEIAEKIVKEASEVITAASSEKIYDMFKEFAELAIVMCAFAEHLPEEMVNAAGEEALEYWQRKVGHSARYGHGMMRYSDGDYHEEMRRMYRSRHDDYDNPLRHYRRG
jgi:phosphoribosyl-ATP pyrophosphohydrolase